MNGKLQDFSIYYQGEGILPFYSSQSPTPSKDLKGKFCATRSSTAWQSDKDDPSQWKSSEPALPTTPAKNSRITTLRGGLPSYFTLLQIHKPQQ